jgi:ribosomal protein L14E/L6E/L27E
VQVLIDGPAPITGMGRKVLPLRHLRLTSYTVDITRHARQKQLLKAWGKADVAAKFAASSWGKKIAARETKKGLTDFDRFQIKLEKQKVRAWIKTGGGVDCVEEGPGWWAERAARRFGWVCVCSLQRPSRPGSGRRDVVERCVT